MKYINLDAANWSDVGDFFNDIKKNLRSPDWHGSSIDALIDSIIFGGINEVEPPYQITITNISNINIDLLHKLNCIVDILNEEIKIHDIEKNISVKILSM